MGVCIAFRVDFGCKGGGASPVFPLCLQRLDNGPRVSRRPLSLSNQWLHNSRREDLLRSILIIVLLHFCYFDPGIQFGSGQRSCPWEHDKAKAQSQGPICLLRAEEMPMLTNQSEPTVRVFDHMRKSPFDFQKFCGVISSPHCPPP